MDLELGMAGLSDREWFVRPKHRTYRNSDPSNQDGRGLRMPSRFPLESYSNSYFKLIVKVAGCVVIAS